MTEQRRPAPQTQRATSPATPAPQRQPRGGASAQGMIDTAPASGKSPYLRLPENVQLFEPVVGKTYRAAILSWRGSASNPSTYGRDGVWVAQRYIFVHARIGPADDTYLCPLKTFNKPDCRVCREFQFQRQQQPRNLSQQEGKKYYNDIILPFKYKERELWLLHLLDDDNPQNVYLWDESIHLFGKFLRERMALNEKHKSFAHPDSGKTVVFRGTVESLGSGSGTYNKFSAIDFEDREPIPDWLYKLSESLCPDEWLIETPNSKLISLFESEPEPEQGNGRSHFVVGGRDQQQEVEDTFPTRPETDEDRVGEWQGEGQDPSNVDGAMDDQPDTQEPEQSQDEEPAYEETPVQETKPAPRKPAPAQPQKPTPRTAPPKPGTRK